MLTRAGSEASQGISPDKIGKRKATEYWFLILACIPRILVLPLSLSEGNMGRNDRVNNANKRRRALEERQALTLKEVAMITPENGKGMCYVK